jgi:ABC-type transporter Mla MlaB component
VTTSRGEGDVSGYVVLALEGTIVQADVPRLCARLRSRVRAGQADEAGDVSVVVCDVRALARADAVAVDALARLTLTAYRCGCRVVLRNASQELACLLALAGLTDVISGCADSPVHQLGQAEHGEQVGVEEVRDRDDPTL